MTTQLEIRNKPLSLRGRSFVGTVVNDRMTDTVTVMWERKQFNAKYQRYEQRRSKVHAHNPKGMNAKKGDQVRIVETRPISKTKHFVVVEVLNGAEAKVEKKAVVAEKAEKKAPAKKLVKKTEKKE